MEIILVLITRQIRLLQCSPNFSLIRKGVKRGVTLKILDIDQILDYFFAFYDYILIQQKKNEDAFI